MRRHDVLLGALLLVGAAALANAQQPVEFDLAGPTTQTRPTPASVVRLRVVNRMPGKDYKISIVDRVMDIDAFPPLGGAAAVAGGNTCDTLLAAAKKLSAADGPKNEADVAKSVSAIDASLAAGDCNTPSTQQQIQLELGKTMLDVPGTYPVSDGHELVLTVSRLEGDKTLTWTLTLQGASRGKWVTTYGMAFSPNKDEKYFAKSTGDKQFTITAQREPGGLKPMPAVFFTWLPRSRQDKDLVVGPTAGFGLEGGNRPAIFGGLTFTYNWNLGFVVGVGIVPETRLVGQYTPGDMVTENLADDALHTTVVRARAAFAFTFRFGSNPFTAPSSSSSGKKD